GDSDLGTGAAAAPALVAAGEPCARRQPGTLLCLRAGLRLLWDGDWWADARQHDLPARHRTGVRAADLRWIGEHDPGGGRVRADHRGDVGRSFRLPVPLPGRLLDRLRRGPCEWGAP